MVDGASEKIALSVLQALLIPRDAIVLAQDPDNLFLRKSLGFIPNPHPPFR